MKKKQNGKTKRKNELTCEIKFTSQNMNFKIIHVN